MTHTGQSRGLVDGPWYWVRFETAHPNEVIQAPAMYKASADTWYSYQFNGIRTFQIDVVGPVNYAIASPCWSSECGGWITGLRNFSYR